MNNLQDIYVRLKVDVSNKEPLQYPLMDVLGAIANNEYSDIVKRYQDTGNKEHKKELPAFQPALDNNDIATGLIQFDIDAQDNTKLDMECFKQELESIPELAYYFTSPNGQGVKFAILTDFDGAESQYKQAYNHVLTYLKTVINAPFTTDDSVGHLTSLCFLSADENGYYNELPTPFLVHVGLDEDDIQHVVEQAYQQPSASIDEVLMLLEHIPNDLKYDDRMKVNYAVFNVLGNAGTRVLSSHWNKEPKKLFTQLKDQLKGWTDNNQASYGNTIGALIKLAQEYGYVIPTGWAARNQVPEKTDHMFHEMLEPDVASTQIRGLIQSFFEEKRSMIINVSTGFGKTEITMQELLKQKANVLILLKSHKFAEEFKERLINQGKSKVKQSAIISKINHLKGRNKLCHNTEVLEHYLNAGVPMPMSQCDSLNCKFSKKCDYKKQFERKSNIRIMTHNELVNRQAIWDKESGWYPDYIITDEG